MLLLGQAPMHLRVMSHDDIAAALRLCRLADWNQIAADWRFFLASSPGGCRVALDHMGDVIGTVATIAYGSAFSWIGMVLVDPEHRRTGVGTRLLHEALELLGDETTARLDATPAGHHVYTPLGFCDEYGLQRMVRLKPDDLSHSFEATADHRSLGSGGQVDSLRPLSDADFAAIAAADREAFGGDRRALLNRLRSEAPEYAWAIGAAGVDGYAFGRHGHAFEQIGPVVAIDDARARRLVSACMSAHRERSYVIDVPRREEWIAWLQSEGFRLQRPFVRMRRGEQRYRDCVDRLFAIAGPEFG